MSEILDKNLEIIDNALQTSTEQVESANDAAQRAITEASSSFYFNQQYTAWNKLASESGIYGSIDEIETSWDEWVNTPVEEPEMQNSLQHYIYQDYDDWNSTATEPNTQDELTYIDKGAFPEWDGITAEEPSVAAEADDSIKYFIQEYSDWAPVAEEPPIYFPETAEETDPFYRYESERDYLTNWLTGLFANFFATYYPLSNDAFDEAVAWLENTIVNGGTGLPDEIETQIWQRHRDNIRAEIVTQKDAIYADFSARGFSLPPGALLARTTEIDNKGTLKNIEASRDLAVKRMEIEIENIKFAVEQATKLRLQAMNAANDYIKAMMLAPDTAAKLVDFANDAQAKLISATADFYRARLQRDDLLLKSWAGLMEQKSKDGSINADMQAKMLSASADLYKARLTGDEMSLKAWNTFVETGIKADTANIDARLKAKATDADVYKSRIAKDELELKGWSTTLEQTGKDKAANLQAEVSAINASANLFKARIDDKEMSLKAWLADVESKLKRDVANIEAQAKALSVGADMLRARVANQQLSLEAWKTLLEQKGRDGATNTQAWASSIEARVRAAIGAADAYGRTAAAALESLTSITSVSTQAFEE